MQRPRVVDLAPDASCGQVGAEGVPPGRADDELMPDVPDAGGFLRQREGGLPCEHHGPGVDALLREHPPVAGRVALSRGDPSVQVRELGAEDGGLERVQAEVAAERFAEVLRRLPMVPKEPDAASQSFVAG